MAHKQIIDDPLWTGLNCDSEQSKLLETPSIPRVTCDMRNVSGMFPPAFNQLRSVLYNEHCDLWDIVGGMMIYNHDMFFEYMNTALDMNVTPDLGMQGACEQWLAGLANRPTSFRNRRIIAEINTK